MSVIGVGYTSYVGFVSGVRVPEASFGAPSQQSSMQPPSSLPEVYSARTGFSPMGGYGQSALMFNADGDSVQFSIPAQQSMPTMPLAAALPPQPAQPSMSPQTGAEAPGSPKELIPEMPGSGLLDKIKPEGECKTCAERKYVDGSDDPSVSYQTPTKISAANSGAAVAAHEQEHVRHEQADAQKEGRQVVSQTVTLHYDCCPECGRSYVSGGTTRTMSVGKKENPMAAQQNNNESGKAAE